MQGPGFNLQYLKKKKNPEGNKDYQCLNACLPRVSAKTNNKKEPRKFVLTDFTIRRDHFSDLFLALLAFVSGLCSAPPPPLRLGLTVSQAAFEQALTLQV